MIVALANEPLTHGPAKVIYVSASGPTYGIDELAARATIVALVQPTDDGTTHWNNDRNTEWWPSPDSGKAALIVRDNHAKVMKSYRGSASELSFRTVGGVAGGVEMVFDDGPHLSESQQYIVFLEAVDWPTEDGVDQVLAPVAEGQGIFALNGAGDYENTSGLVIHESLVLGE
ncbi:MAG TPA: hypothetical protein VFN14_03835 [Candidatus Limnocylindria bacterium]|nr:hypothetical protein [Candidatus Limnocylindria bacterium]